MKVYVCYRSGHDYSNEPFAVCSALEIATKECVKNLQVYKEYDKDFNIENCTIGEIKDSYSDDIKSLTIKEPYKVTSCSYGSEEHRYEIWETEVL